MEVILIQDIDTLGYKNDIVKVRDGYARNYLIPQHLAVLATPANRKQLAENLRQQARKIAQALADAQALAVRLEQQPSLTLAVRANEDGKIFGAVTTQMIADALAAAGFDIDRRIIKVEPVKQLGEAQATARLHRDVTATIRLNITRAEE